MTKVTAGEVLVRSSSITDAVKRKAPGKNGTVYSLTHDTAILLRKLQLLKSVRQE